MRYHLAYYWLTMRNAALEVLGWPLTDQLLAQQYIAALKRNPRYRRQFERIERSRP